MPINLNVAEPEELKPRILVFGVGGAGGNAVNNMIADELEGADFVVANTDAQALSFSKSKNQIQIGRTITQGLGAGARPEIGRAAAEEAIDDIISYLEGSHMCFITAGMGGGTGTGAAPVIARAARERDILTVGVVTKPFQFEGSHRMRMAEEGIVELQQYVDTLIIIPNQNLFRIANERTTFAEAFAMADEVLHSGVRGITDLMVMPGLINLDFADVRSVMNEMGKAMMGTGESEGESRAVEAAEAAISNPLLDDISMKGAQGVLINITGGMDMTLFEVDEAANRIRSEVDPDANIIIGSTFSEAMEGKIRVSIVATGIDADVVTVPKLEAQPAAAVSFHPPLAAETPAPAPEALPAAATAAEKPAAKSPEPEDKIAAFKPEGSQSDTGLGQNGRPGRDEPFIAPPPAEVKPTPKTLSFPSSPAPLITPQPAAASGSSGGGLMRRGLSLIERMKGETRPTPDAPDDAAIAEPAAAVSNAPQEALPKAEEAIIVSKPRSSHEAAEPSLFSATEDDENIRLNEEDDQLEIPAFLRRQAN